MDTGLAGEGVSFGWEPVETLINEPNATELVRAQYDEFTRLPEDIQLDPDVGRMLASEKAGVYRVWAARRDGMLIGWIEFVISPGWHNKSVRFAFDGGHYLAPEFGSTHTALKMWRSALVALEALGVRVVTAHDNPVRPLDAFFRRLGFDPGGKLYVKVL